MLRRVMDKLVPVAKNEVRLTGPEASAAYHGRFFLQRYDRVVPEPSTHPAGGQGVSVVREHVLFEYELRHPVPGRSVPEAVDEQAALIDGLSASGKGNRVRHVERVTNRTRLIAGLVATAGLLYLGADSPAWMIAPGGVSVESHLLFEPQGASEFMLPVLPSGDAVQLNAL